MFEYLVPRPPDAIMALMQQCKADTNPDKIDLGVGVYKDASGETLILKSVKQAEINCGKPRRQSLMSARAATPIFAMPCCI